jgi:hypothetical protein
VEIGKIMQPDSFGYSPLKATPRSEAFRLRFEPLHRHLCPYEFPCDSQGRVHSDAFDDQTLLQYLYVRGLIGVDYCLPRMVVGESLMEGLRNSVMRARWERASREESMFHEASISASDTWSAFCALPSLSDGQFPPSPSSAGAPSKDSRPRKAAADAPCLAGR